MDHNILFGLLAAFLTLFLNYAFGKPGSQFAPNEIFSFYTVWLAKLRLKRLGVYDFYREPFLKSLASAKTEYERRQLKTDQRKVLYESAEPFFMWEKAAGMCVVCFGVWVSLIFGLCTVGLDYFSLLKIIVICHVTIRLLTKIYDS